MNEKKIEPNSKYRKKKRKKDAIKLKNALDFTNKHKKIEKLNNLWHQTLVAAATQTNKQKPMKEA